MVTPHIFFSFYHKFSSGATSSFHKQTIN